MRFVETFLSRRTHPNLGSVKTATPFSLARFDGRNELENEHSGRHRRATEFSAPFSSSRVTLGMSGSLFNLDLF